MYLTPHLALRMQSPRVTRRSFLLGGLAATTLAATARRPLKAADAIPPEYRAAVIGHTGKGDYGHGLETIFQKRAGIRTVAVVDPDQAAARRVADRIGATSIYADPVEMLRKEKPELVSIAMRHSVRHHEIARACLEAGAHLYCEKPFVVSPAEADDLLELAERKGRRIAVAHTMRMMPVIRQLRSALTQERFGKLIEIRAYGKQDARAGGEDLMVLGTHLFDLMRLFAGDPTWCNARISTQGRDISRADARRVRDDVGPVAGDRVAAQFGFKSVVVATFTSAAELRSTVGHWGLELHCTDAVVRVNCDITPHVFVRRPVQWSAEGRNDAWLPFDAAAVGAVPAAEHNAGPVADWLDAIARQREPECSGRNGAWAVDMALATYASALGANRVTFPLQPRTHPLGGP